MNSNNKKQPNLVELAEWSANPTTKWILSKARQFAPDPLGMMPVKSEKDAYMINYYAGCAAIINKINDIADGR